MSLGLRSKLPINYLIHSRDVFRRNADIKSRLLLSYPRDGRIYCVQVNVCDFLSERERGRGRETWAKRCGMGLRKKRIGKV